MIVCGVEGGKREGGGGGQCREGIREGGEFVRERSAERGRKGGSDA